MRTGERKIPTRAKSGLLTPVSSDSTSGHFLLSKYSVSWITLPTAVLIPDLFRGWTVPSAGGFSFSLKIVLSKCQRGMGEIFSKAIESGKSSEWAKLYTFFCAFSIRFRPARLHPLLDT